MTPTPELKQSLSWIFLAALVGFLVPAVFSMELHWERSLFLVPYVAIVGGFLLVYFRRTPIPPRRLIDNWPYGLVAAAATFLLLRNIQGQPPSAIPEGGQLVLSLVWVGLVYGALDGLFLNVMPVLAVQGPGFLESNPTRRERLSRGLLALAASILVTVAYHFGYAEFHGAGMVSVIIGNAIITSAYLLTGSPLAAVVTHVITHVAAVLHGMGDHLAVAAALCTIALCKG
jgi:hypothetical protein